VNCGALPDNLVESELFGHVRGAFTGAERDRAGLIESAHGGTLFLDEIGELPLAAQAKLLRFLQESEIRRVGDSATRKADVRVVAATHRQLEQCVDDGTFREDLFYRIKVIEIAVPPLRERGADVILLARAFLAAERNKQVLGPERFTDAVEASFLSYSWDGNVRELQNAVRAAFAIAGESRVIDVRHLPDRIARVAVVKRGGTYHDEVMRFRRSLIETALTSSSGNQNQAAKHLGMSRQALNYQIRELRIDVAKFAK
jgi:transcriptional regulator with PAS, ATPase and Fis domain